MDGLVYRRADSSVGHAVYHKPTHTDLYLHTSSAYHSAHKKSMLWTLIHRAMRLSDNQSLHGGLEHLRHVFLGEGDSPSDNDQVMVVSGNQRAPPESEAEKDVVVQ